jgi:hypothetical protein
MNAEDERKQTKCIRKLKTYGIATPLTCRKQISFSGKRSCGGNYRREGEDETVDEYRVVDNVVDRKRGTDVLGSSDQVSHQHHITSTSNSFKSAKHPFVDTACHVSSRSRTPRVVHRLPYRPGQTRKPSPVHHIPRVTEHLS